VRALEERVTLTSKLQHDAERRQHRLVAANWARRASEAQRELDVIRDALRRIDALRAGALRQEAEDLRLVPEPRPAK
jgi:hypothetical protein